MTKKLIGFLICILSLMVPLSFSNIYPKFIENLTKESEEISVLIVLNNKRISKDKIEFTDDLEYNQKVTLKMRKQNREYYLKHNNDFVNEKVNTIGDINISEYAPVIFISFDNYNSYSSEKNNFQKLSKLDDIEKIYVEETPRFCVASLNSETNVNSSDSLKLVDIEEAKKIIKVNGTSGYTGDGVKVGIIDEGYPNNTLNFTKNEIVEYNTLISSPHTNKVASIIGGTYGIAPESDLFIHSYSSSNSNYNFDDAIEWLLGKGVNVVNISMYSDASTGNQGRYDGHSAYLDYIVWHNYLTIVKSAGNRGKGDDYVTNPGIGMNTISVGSIDGNKSISDYSSWNVNTSIEGILMNPTLVAPGENIIIQNTVNSKLNSSGTALSNDYSGTSFAAPMVTGVIALLMEEFPRLMQYPETYMSAIISSASKLPSQTTVWDTYAGAGLINYEKAREILSSSNYVNYTTTNSTDSSVALISKEVSVGAYDWIDYCLVSVQNSNVTSPSSTIYSPNISNYQIIIYDDNNLVLETIEYGEYSNLHVGTLTNSTSTTKNYTIKVFVTDKSTSYNEYLSLSVSIELHPHSYNDSYLWKSYTHHFSCCRCGAKTENGHAVSSNAFAGGKRYANCLFCGGLAERGFVQIDALSAEVQYVTNNGSFILPNGVIVLADEDIETYLHGNLEFYKKDNALLVE